MRTDVKAFYESIDHNLMLDKLSIYIKDRFTLNLLWQSMHRCVERGGLFRDIQCGIPRGCPLSPLLGAFFLAELDQAMEHKDVFYVRYMDDVLIMSKRRWGLRNAIKRLNGIFNALGLEKHPDKTFVGRIEKGFDFLGYRFSKTGLKLATNTLANAVEKVHRLYEQKQTAPERAAALDDYLSRWVRWTTAGLNGLAVPGAVAAAEISHVYCQASGEQRESSQKRYAVCGRRFKQQVNCVSAAAIGSGLRCQ